MTSRAGLVMHVHHRWGATTCEDCGLKQALSLPHVLFSQHSNIVGAYPNSKSTPRHMHAAFNLPCPSIATSQFAGAASGRAQLLRSAAAAVQGECPATAVPAPTDADVELCTAPQNDAPLGNSAQGLHTDACGRAAASTECTDTVLADAAGSTVIPAWCLEYDRNRSVAVFDCPASAPPLQAAHAYCSQSNRTAECGNEFCVGGDTVRSPAGAAAYMLHVKLKNTTCEYSSSEPSSRVEM